MASLIETIEAEILLSGGIAATLAMIEYEWSDKNTPSTGSVWKKSELEILERGLKAIALSLGRSEFSIARKSYNLAYKKALAK
jgi:hypothetical protein